MFGERNMDTKKSTRSGKDPLRKTARVIGSNVYYTKFSDGWFKANKDQISSLINENLVVLNGISKSILKEYQKHKRAVKATYDLRTEINALEYNLQLIVGLLTTPQKYTKALDFMIDGDSPYGYSKIRMAAEAMFLLYAIGVGKYEGMIFQELCLRKGCGYYALLNLIAEGNTEKELSDILMDREKFKMYAEELDACLIMLLP